jgi:hypothetical protein
MLSRDYGVKKESIFAEIKRLTGRDRRAAENKQYAGQTKPVKIETKGEAPVVIRKNAPTEMAERKLLYLMFINRQAAKRAETGWPWCLPSW